MKKKMVKLKEAYVVKMTIMVTRNGQISVNGFPKNIHQAADVMDSAKKAIINYFLEKATNGNLDQLGNVTDEKIIMPGKNIIIPGGKRA